MPSPWEYTPTVQYGTAATLNPFMQTQARQALQMNLPMYGQNVAQRGRNVSSFLQGQVPEDVVQQIQQRGAERGIATGMTGGPNVNAAWLRALGLTSLGLMGTGSEMLSRSIADTPVAELWNPISLYVPERLGQQELAAAQAGTRASRSGGYSGFSPMYIPGAAPLDMSSSSLSFNRYYPTQAYGPLSTMEESAPSNPFKNYDWNAWNEQTRVAKFVPQDPFSGEGTGSYQ